MAKQSSLNPDYQKLKRINSCYHDAKRLANEALRQDEMGESDLAIQSYTRCLKYIEDGVGVDIGSDPYSGPEWNDARNQQQKLLSLQRQANDRIASLRSCDIPPSHKYLPSYSEKTPNGHVSMCGSSTSDPVAATENITELLLIPGGVQLFFISEDNRVAAPPPSYPTFLKVLVDSVDCVFIQVSDWKYPLVPEQTPVFKTNAGAYLFPNHISQSITEGSVGIVISTEVDENLIDLFESVLRNLAVFRMQQQEDDIDITGEEGTIGTFRLGDNVKVPFSDRVTANIEKGAGWLSSGIGEAARYTTAAVKRGSENLKNKLVPSDKPVPISPTVQTSLYYAHEASKATVKVTQYLVYGLCAVTSRVGEEIAPHIKEYSKKVLPKSATSRGENDQEESVVDGAVKVAGASISGLATVWTELERSGIAIAEAVSKATVENVEFKYGKHAGSATSNVMGSVVNVGKTAFNLDNLGMKAIAKRTAKDTGHAFLRQHSLKDHKHNCGSEV